MTMVRNLQSDCRSSYYFTLYDSTEMSSLRMRRLTSVLGMFFLTLQMSSSNHVFQSPLFIA